MKVLFIDDERWRAKPLVDYMTIVCNWTVYRAAGPREAMGILENPNLPNLDVIILDIMMDPEGVIDLAESDRGRSTGLLLIDKIRAVMAEVPILIYTARIDVDRLRDDPRVAALVQKPSTARTLVSEIKSVLAARRED